jgi:hypothetical protein
VFFHVVKKTTPFVASKFYTPEERHAAREKIKESFGVPDYFIDSIQFFYERKPESARNMAKIKYLKSQVSKLRRDGNLSEDAEERYRQAIESLETK